MLKVNEIYQPDLNMLTEEEYKKCTLEKRYHLLKEDGDFIASRFSESFNVHLFSLYGFYVEMWQRISLPDVVWIEVVNAQNVLHLYTGGIDLKKDLGME